MDDLKHAAALHCWPIRHSRTPSGKMTWADWFKMKHDQTLEEYRSEFNNKKASLSAQS